MVMSERHPSDREIRVKFLGKYKPGHDGEGWLRMFPDNEPVWGNCRFIFDRHCRDYDWLVVYDDLPSLAGERHPLWEERLACPSTHTLLITSEPSSIKAYGSSYLRQFHWLLTSSPAWGTAWHPGRIHQQPALIWFYADSSPRGDYNHIRTHVPLQKTRLISTVCSSKRHGRTLHARRHAFTWELKRLIPELEIYGHGVRPLADKADALDPYKYHVAVENYAGPHHWTEKLADAFLGACMPIYHGCPNVADYFPPESFITIDVWDTEAAAETIRKAIRDRAWEKNLDAILESRRRVLEEYGTIATICRIVNEHHTPASGAGQPPRVIASRRRLHRHPVRGLAYLLEKGYVRARHLLTDKYLRNR
ncbi:MAG: glycosyltransferase [Gammaproteobacteria bacterium]|nr:MAG: glycosyltransferase [Gammaproteobacteria bacterium]